MKEIKYYVYCIQNKLTNKIYIGKSINPEKRWKSEIKCAFNKKDSAYYYPLSCAFRKYAKTKDEVWYFFNFMVLEEFDNKQDSYDSEMFFIEFYRSNVKRFGNDHGYNQTDGGEYGVSGFKHTDKNKRQYSILNIGESNWAAKLNWEKVAIIRNDYENKKNNVGCKKFCNFWAKEFNIGWKAIFNIIKNKTWKIENYINLNNIINETEKIKTKIFENKTVKQKNIKFTDEEIKDIRNSYKNGVKIIDLAEKYEVSVVSIEAIVKNKYYYDSNYVYIYIKAVRTKYGSKLNFEIAQSIRKDYKTILESYPKLSEKYKISIGTVAKVIKNKIWVK